MKLNNALIGIGVLLAAVGLYMDRRSTSAQIRSLHEELADLRANERAREDRATKTPIFVASQLRMLAAMRDQNPGVAPAPSTSGAQDLPRLESPRRKSNQNSPPVEDYAPIYESLEGTFAREGVDSSWARNADRLARNDLEAHLPAGSRITALDCHSSMCRVESTHESRLSANELVQNALAEPSERPWNGSFATGTTVEDKATGRVTVVTYLMREGHDLPRIEALEEGAE